MMGLTGNTVLMPDTAPLERSQGIEKMGVKVERMKSSQLLQGVERLQQENGAVFLHPFDDRHLIAGYGSLGLEILQDVPDADFVLVCCGGGGLLAGTATALAYFSAGKRIRVFGVEPETASGMRMSLQVITRVFSSFFFLKANFHYTTGWRSCKMSRSEKCGRWIGSTIRRKECLRTCPRFC